MRKIKSHAELTELIRQGDGFVFNNRVDRRMLHQVNCESLEVMSTRAYEKLFFEDLDEAKKWLDGKYGAHGWEVCGLCRCVTD
jgi:putative lipase involved disintegration of autophagic bodies